MPRRRESTKGCGSESLNRPSSILPRRLDSGRRSNWKRHDWTPPVRKQCGWRPNVRTQCAWRPNVRRPYDKTRHDKRRHDKRPHGKRQHEKTRHGKTRHDKRRHGKRPHGKRPHDKRPHDKRRHGKTRHDKRRHDKRRHDKRRHDKRRHDKRRHDKRPPADGKRCCGLLDDSWTRRPPGVKRHRRQRASYPCRAAHVEAGSSVAPTPTRNSSCTRKRGAERSS